MSAITEILARWGALPSKELLKYVADEIGSERTMQRAIKTDAHVLRLGHTKRSAYALRRPEIAPVPILLRDEQGRDHTVATLVALAAGQWWVEPTAEAPDWMLLGERSGTPGVFQGLPWYLEPFRPAGFLGRAWVREHAQAHGWTLDANAWTDDQVISAALQEAWDWRGNLGLARIADAADTAVLAENRFERYAELANQLLNGVMVGASADGEQPKFAAVVDDGKGQPPRSVLVKFSPPLAHDPAARRWGDIMVTEGMVAQVMTLHGMSAAPTQVWRHQDRIWLETTRFDRINERGRKGMASLRSLAQTFGYNGPQNGWVNAVEYLYQRNAIDAEQVARTQRLANIGHLMAHTDMHMGNLSFLLSNDAKSPLSVAPAYDMAPMRWAPSSTTGVVPELMKEAPPQVDDSEAMNIAREVWEVVADHDEVTPEWAEWAKDRARHLKEAVNRAAMRIEGRSSG
ncbi:HipA domain-containing protein [Dyella acidiphila]|uniref:HipA domain-containing protein n=1 Tax=Dyella acidiphila TaxID=2775866 RepID=A0ABR9G9A0_9GAMM|nr:HipA domain-containing protein [Dyella acidiphila]MBE1160596.1 HipA domain-containing protein [Dyella acidiphila]